jgi:hypothetical protein
MAYEAMFATGLGEAVREGIMAATASHDKLEYISMANVFMDKFSLARS